MPFKKKLIKCAGAPAGTAPDLPPAPPDRIQLAGPSGIDPGALEAQFQLRCRGGGLMGITGIPHTQEAYLEWMLNRK